MKHWICVAGLLLPCVVLLSAGCAGTGWIGTDAAAEIALRHAGAAPETTEILDRSFEEEGIPTHTLIFRDAEMRYCYQVEAQGGEILWYRCEPAESEEELQLEQSRRDAQIPQLSLEQAAALALETAGVDEGDCSELTARLFTEEGWTVCEVQMRQDLRLHSVKIDCATGTVMEDNETELSQDGELTAEEARELLRSRLGIPRRRITLIESAERGWSGEIPVWIVRAEYEGRQYRMTVSARDGSVLDYRSRPAEEV